VNKKHAANANSSNGFLDVSRLKQLDLRGSKHRPKARGVNGNL